MTLLDEYQQVPVEYEDSALCTAGPGSGKTRVLSTKAEEVSRAGQSVICLTFTRAAAQEIRNRIPGILAGTIHSLCVSVVGWEKDHDDLLTRYIRSGKDKYDWVLVDEVQDLTPEQMQVVLSLVKNKLFAVGDPYQSIYGYGGALGSDVVDMLKFKAGCKEFYLQNNYRSTPRIVNGLNQIYSRDLKSVGTKENGITAILCRSKDTVNAVSDLLLKEKIGHIKKYGGTEKIYGSANLRVATIHTCKGLEFSNVILHGWIPKKRFSNSGGVDEETNVYYVAMSRAVSGYMETDTPKDLLTAIKAYIPDLDKLRFSEDGSSESNNN